MATTFKGLLYVKHGRVGTRSEGPDYFLQAKRQDYQLELNSRNPWDPDYQLEFYCRRMVEVTGNLDEGENPPLIRVSSIRELLSGNLP